MKNEQSSVAELYGPFDHDLLSRNIRPTRNWHEWLKLWRRAKTFQELLGLLHFGLNVSLEPYQYPDEHGWWYREPEHNHTERLMFYFRVADGWNDPYLLGKWRDEPSYRTSTEKGTTEVAESELRQAIARKAFDSLGPVFGTKLKPDLCEPGFSYAWGNQFTAEPLFGVIQHFFRVQTSQLGDCDGIRNLTGQDKVSHIEEQAIGFLLNLARFMWQWKGETPSVWRKDEERAEIEKTNAIVQARLDAAKPWMIEVLSFLNRLDVLERWMCTLEPPCVQKLKEIALRNKLTNCNSPVRKDRPVKDLEEACYVGSAAAWFLARRDVRLAIEKKVKKLTDAERELEEAKSKLEQLSGK